MDALDTKLEQRIRDLAAPVAETMGLALWGVELSGESGRRVVRLFIESPEGVTIDQCAEVSRQLGVMFEVEDVIPGAYRLEVSSPGLERPFFTLEQVAGYVGRKLDVRLAEPIGNRKNFRGRLTRAGEGRIVLDQDGTVFDIEWRRVKKARLLVEDWASEVRPKAGGGKA